MHMYIRLSRFSGDCPEKMLPSCRCANEDRHRNRSFACRFWGRQTSALDWLVLILENQWCRRFFGAWRLACIPSSQGQGPLAIRQRLTTHIHLQGKPEVV